MAVQDIVLGGFGNSGSVELVVLSGFTGGIAKPVSVEVNSGGWYIPPYRKRKRFKFDYEEEEERKAAELLETIIEKVSEQPKPAIETVQDMELAFRLRLANEQIRFQEKYLKWLSLALETIRQDQERRRRIKVVTLLLLH